MDAPVGLSAAAHGWREWGGAGPVLHFAHANGLPPESYRPVLGPLAERFRVVTSEARPLWSDGDPEQLDGWAPLVEDLRHALDEHDVAGAIGVGHSLGGVLSILAQAEDPTLFRGLVLVDPVIFAGLRSAFWGALRRLGLGGRLPLVRTARRRRERWPDRRAVRRAWRSKELFRGWSAEAFDAYVEAAFRDDGAGGVVLRYPRDWEARIFEVTPADLWRRLRRIAIPVLAVRGARSDTFLAGAARRLVRELPRAELVELDGVGHFVPQERPEEVVRLILELADRL